MGIEQVFNGVVDLSKSEYFFTQSVTFWQVFFSILSIFFMSLDTAINDIVDRIIISISHNLKQKMEKLVIEVGGLFCPRVAYA
jgi:hypothetical protein